MRLYLSLPVAGILAAALSFGLACSPYFTSDAPERRIAERRVRAGVGEMPRKLLVQAWLIKGPPELSAVLGLGAEGVSSPDIDISIRKLRQDRRFRKWEASGALTEFRGPLVPVSNGGEAEFFVGAPGGNPRSATRVAAPAPPTEGIRLKVRAVATRLGNALLDLEGALYIPAAPAGAISLKQEMAAKIRMPDGGMVALKVGDAAPLQQERAGLPIYCLLIGVEIQP